MAIGLLRLHSPHCASERTKQARKTAETEVYSLCGFVRLRTEVFTGAKAENRSFGTNKSSLKHAAPFSPSTNTRKPCLPLRQSRQDIVCKQTDQEQVAKESARSGSAGARCAACPSRPAASGHDAQCARENSTGDWKSDLGLQQHVNVVSGTFGQSGSRTVIRPSPSVKI